MYQGKYPQQEPFDIEFQYALQQLVASGLVEMKEGDLLRLTRAGSDKVVAMLDSFDPQDRILLMLHYFDIYERREREQSDQS